MSENSSSSASELFEGDSLSSLGETPRRPRRNAIIITETSKDDETKRGGEQNTEWSPWHVDFRYLRVDEVGFQGGPLPPLRSPHRTLDSINWTMIWSIVTHLEAQHEVIQKRSSRDTERFTMEQGRVNELLPSVPSCICGAFCHAPVGRPIPVWLNKPNQYAREGLLESIIAAKCYGHPVMTFKCDHMNHLNKNRLRDPLICHYYPHLSMSPPRDSSLSTMVLQSVEKDADRWQIYRGRTDPVNVPLFHSGTPNYPKAYRYAKVLLDQGWQKQGRGGLPPVTLSYLGPPPPITVVGLPSQPLPVDRWVVQDGAHRLLGAMLAGLDLEVFVKIRKGWS